MRRRRLSWRRASTRPGAAPVRLLAMVLVGALGSSAPAAGGSRDDHRLGAWAEGPVKWLLLPAEHREMRRVDSAAEAINFIERFWSRRDPNPSEPGNAFRESFFRRVEAADLLYGEEDRRGSLTDRGRALILLGPPGGLRISSKPSLQWSPRVRQGSKVVVRELPQEVWTYPLADLPEVLAAALAELSEEEEVRLTFLSEPGRTYLSRGEEALDLAARVAVARPH